ncbi:MAG: hypothetical protein U0Q47_08105 [Mycobacterium sp.]
MRFTLMRILGALLAALTMLGVGGGATSSADGPLPADQIVFMVSSGGGLVPPVVYALESPSLVIYGDGRILSMVRDNNTPGAVPARYQLTQTDPVAVASFASWVQSRGIIDSAKDFGQPSVTDMDGTTVLVHGEGAPAKVSVYAFHDEFDKYVTPAQQQARAALREVVDAGMSLAAAGPPIPYSPDRVVVYDVGLGYGDRKATAVWPGPPPDSFLTPSNQGRSVACGYLTGAPATAAYDAALDNPGALWLVDGTTRVLAVNPFPLADSCP